MTCLKNIFALLVFLSGIIVVSAQNISYKLYTPHDGLPQSQVLCMFQDSRGYIWVGTNYGVSYFNGVKFHNITPKDGLPYSSVWQIQEDLKGNIWFYTGKWMCKYDGQKLSFDTVNIRVHDAKFFIDKHGIGWGLDTRDHFLYKSKDFRKWERVSCQDTTFTNKQWSEIRYDKRSDKILLRDLLGYAVIYSQNSLITLLPHGVWFQHFGLNSNELSYGTVADSIFSFENGQFKFLKKTIVGVLDVVKRSDGSLCFIEIFGKKLYKIQTTGKIDTFPLNVSATNILFEDKDKNIWIGTEEGLMLVYPEGFINFDKKQLNSIWSMVEDTAGGMWLGSFYTTRQIHYYKNEKLQKIEPPNVVFNPKLPGKEFGQFYFGGGRDVKGNLYFPMGWGIMKYDGKHFSTFDKPAKDQPDRLSMNFYLDNEKNILVSGTAGGANVIDLNTGQTKYYGRTKGMQRTSYVLGVGKDGEGDYWLGTNVGISRLDLRRDSIIKNYLPDLKNFSSYGVMAVHGDVKGNIWAGVSQGLLWRDVKKDTFVLVADSIIRSSVTALGSYKDKYLVAVAMDGVYFLDLQAFYNEGGKIKVRCFNQHNGYLGIEPNQNCLYVDSKDNVWVAASDIVTKIRPSELEMKPQPLVPYITQINNEKIPYTQYNQVIELPYGVNTAKVFFEAVGFERPFNTEFSYRLNNDSFSVWRPENFEILDNLSSGIYTFQVRTRPAGSYDEADVKFTRIRFKVNVPIHRNAYFPVLALLCLMLLGGGSWWFIKKGQLREQRTKQEHQAYLMRQEQFEEARTRQIKYLQIQTLQAQLNPHFIFGVLQAVQTRIYQSRKEEAGQLIVDLSQLMRGFLESSINMDFSKLRRSEITLQQEIDLLKTYIEFEQLQYSDRFKYVIHIDENLDAQNVQVPPMMIQPYVENAIKHGILYNKEKEGFLEIRFRRSDNAVLICTITDNGVGRKRAKEIQDSFIRTYKSRSTQILEDRIKIMQEMGQSINVQILDNPDGGTIVQLEIDM